METTRSVPVIDPAHGDRPGHNEVQCGDCLLGDGSSNQLTGQGERRIGHYPDPTAWIAELGSIQLHYSNVQAGRCGHALSELRRASRVQFDGKDGRTGSRQRQRQRPVASTQVDHQLATTDRCHAHQALSPVALQPVPVPSKTSPGHGPSP